VEGRLPRRAACSYQPAARSTRRRRMRLLAKQPIVVGMAANPERHEPVYRFDREGAVVSRDPSRPEQTRTAPILLK